MSLRVFHIVFIVASVVLSVLGGVWGVHAWVANRNASGLMVGVMFVVCGLALVAYASRAFGKLRDLS